MSIADRITVPLLRATFGALRALGPVRASNLGGFVARFIGPHLPVSNVARTNLARVLREAVVVQVWDNLGRTVCELPNMDRIVRSDSGPGFELVLHAGSEDFTSDRGAIYIAAHLANWEVLLSVSHELRKNFGLFYRAAENEAVDQVIRDLRLRAGGPTLKQFAKGSRGGRQGIQHLRAGGAVGLLADQKANDGISVPFFGHPAMTSPSAATMAMKYQLRLMPTRVERLGPARLRVTIEQPLTLPNSGDMAADVATLTAQINARIENWVRARPGDWLWLHRRWPKA
jgi:KDO2-lipid IV(A) lauroyltransferase